MSRRKLVAGNWKMHGLRGQLAEIAKIDAAAAAAPGVDVALCVPATLVHPASEIARSVQIGGQDVHANDRGAHTGCVSAEMLVEAGATIVIVGHSERRADQNETSHDAWAKAAAARRHGLNVILCCGETEAERDAGRAERVVQAQIEKSVPEGASGDWFTLAYEPRWAIGTGRTPSPDEIAQVHAIARAKLRQMVGDAADGIRILYGGSVTGANAAAILSIDDVDGALVGGASLTADKFVPIIEAAASL
ncbi:MULTISPECIES: triose-phosphate isomerase [Sphingomonas]|jgi:triosephosphate isomerase|uniref:Triosephosphate isomerase n=1 Tax=Sphingomonas hankookensis TaxID=563996 RepID=A0ABR5YEX2_9SPHN|nr:MULTISPECIES: triose-phosphate isomerase [Sphingomonas]KZE17892.1 triose-phosphate isomerase [Sphingomonas hankookensis]PZT96549.1 MAG: triose-phosphate isomerase [Sphingomonas sp.]RSV30168.1 triose-phosphate isomerase [Sphingomonas sp. ABOLH]WCP71193.1 triose-phosphate isomerase [Sphingomonas hankookensis]